MDALAPAEVGSAVIFGSGPQALGHAEALLAIRHTSSVTVVGRRGDRRPLDRATDLGARRRRTGSATRGLTVDDPQVEAAVREAQVVVTATSAATPVLDDDWVADGACVVAIGSHEPHRRELGSAACSAARSSSSRTSGRRTARPATSSSRPRRAPSTGPTSHTLADLVLGRVERASDRPNVFKSVGMAWQDLVIAEHVARPYTTTSHEARPHVLHRTRVGTVTRSSASRAGGRRWRRPRRWAGSRR